MAKKSKNNQKISGSPKQTGINLSAVFWSYEPNNAVFTCRWKLLSHEDYSEITSMPEQPLSLHLVSAACMPTSPSTNRHLLLRNMWLITCWDGCQSLLLKFKFRGVHLQPFKSQDWMVWIMLRFGKGVHKRIRRVCFFKSNLHKPNVSWTVNTVFLEIK